MKFIKAKLWLFFCLFCYVIWKSHFFFFSILYNVFLIILITPLYKTCFHLHTHKPTITGRQTDGRTDAKTNRQLYVPTKTKNGQVLNFRPYNIIIILLESYYTWFSKKKLNNNKKRQKIVNKKFVFVKNTMWAIKYFIFNGL